MCTLDFSSWSRFPIVGMAMSSGLVGRANSLARLLFGSVDRYWTISFFKVEFLQFKVSSMTRESAMEKERESSKLQYFSENQSPRRFVTRTPLTTFGAVYVSPSGRLPHLPISRYLPSEGTHLQPGSNSTSREVPKRFETEISRAFFARSNIL